MMYLLCSLTESGKDGSASSDQAEEMDHNKSESEGEEEERKKSRQKPVRKMKRAADSEDSSDEEGVESVKEANERNCNDSPSKTIKNKEDKIKKETGGSDSPSQGKTALQSDAEGDSDSDSSSHKDDDKKGSSTSNESDEGDYPNFMPSIAYHFFIHLYSFFFFTWNNFASFNVYKKKKKPQW